MSTPDMPVSYNMDSVADWFDWVDAGDGDADLFLRLGAYNNIIERLIPLKVEFHFKGWNFNHWRNMRRTALAWRGMYHFLKTMLERSNDGRFNELDRARIIWYVEDYLYYARTAIRLLVPECVMLLVPLKLSLEEQLLEEEMSCPTS